ncbi:MAG: hypothetical protein A3K19_01000 [Lentisphaerae bacterium RIFOXYB12_FULL_65_16]|nr:MAG: hypothetical protein A3K18_24080 [Lentisphaerae bacterium RIFOXYA12_64_32]OGV90546.1 MAG: hypothetical protein A3K19_01000 [Lentisphaerae bacterium RIFOXYB12_FULL_65_16]
MATNECIRLTLPNDLSYLPMALLCVREMARKVGFPETELSKIEIGVEESVSNVIEHAFDVGETGTFDLTCERMPLGLSIRIKEKGMPFDPAHLPEYQPGGDLEKASGPGLGVFLMRKVMDKVSFHNLGMDGKETRLVKYLPSKSIEQYCSEAELRAPPLTSEPAVIKEKIAYDVRGLQEAEAIEVSRCAYKSHGYTFFDEHIYYPERLLKLNQSGELVSAVAVTKDGTFMGHAALHFPYVGAKIAEMTFAFVNVEYRGQGCMNRLCEYLFAASGKQPQCGVYAYAVTNHVITQKVMAKFGINDCGLELATSPATWTFKGIASEDDGNAQRISVALSFKYLAPPARLTVYPPPQHREMIEALDRNIQAEHQYMVPPGTGPSLPEEASDIEVDLHAVEQNADVCIRRYGVAVVRELRAILRDLCLKQVAAINLLLSLEDPATYFLTAEFEKMGLFFSGILPQTRVGDALILQYLNNVALDYDKIHIHTDMGKRILAYVKAHDPNVVG